MKKVCYLRNTNEVERIAKFIWYFHRHNVYFTIIDQGHYGVGSSITIPYFEGRAIHKYRSNEIERMSYLIASIQDEHSPDSKDLYRK